MADASECAPPSAHTIIPYLTIKGAEQAVAYYGQAFDAQEVYRMNCPKTGAVLHSELKIGDSLIYISEEFPSMGTQGPRDGVSPVTIHMNVPDVDAVFEHAVAAGATPTMPPADMFWGDRFAKIIDPFGHHWSIATHVEDLTPEQIQEQMVAAFGAQPSCA